MAAQRRIQGRCGCAVLGLAIRLACPSCLRGRLAPRFSGLLRRTLRGSERREHDLFEELTYVEEYPEIEQTRQPSRVDWQINVEPGCARAAVPSLILIPLVENSVTHGLRGGVRTVAI